jgi:hypothetical protein
MEALTALRSGLQLSPRACTHLPVLLSLGLLRPPSKYETSPNLSLAASRNALRALEYLSQRSATFRTVLSAGPHSHTELFTSCCSHLVVSSPRARRSRSHQRVQTVERSRSVDAPGKARMNSSFRDCHQVNRYRRCVYCQAL